MNQQDSNQQHDDPTSSSEPQSDELKVIFAPGCFDNFEGTQEELQELMAEIHRLVATGEIFEQSEPISDEEVEAMLQAGKTRPRQ